MIRKYWIIFLISVLLLIGFATTLLTSYFAAYRSLGEEIRLNTLPLTSDNIYSEIQKDLVRSIFISSLMAHDTFVRDWVLWGEREPDRIIRFLAEIQKKYDTITSFFVSEKTRLYYHSSGILKEVSESDPRDEWYFRAVAMKEAYEINIDTDTADKNRITIFINYKVHGYNNELIGVTGVGLELKHVREILNTYQNKYNSTVFFVDKSGKVILHANDIDFPSHLNKWQNFTRPAHNILANPGSSFEYETSGHSYYVSSRFIPEFDLTLVILKELDSLKGSLVDRLRLNLIISLLITVFVVIIVGFILKRYNESLERLATIDTLTGAHNRNVFSLIFSQAIAEKKRKKNSLSFIMLDIDYFKSINDNYGHHSGDLVLKTFSETVAGLIRETDVFCRWGGEEFVVLLEDCPIEKVAHVAEKIRKAVSELSFHFGRDMTKITVSAGVAEHRERETLEQLVERVDRLMYQAKEQGRNRVLIEK